MEILPASPSGVKDSEEVRLASTTALDANVILEAERLLYFSKERGITLKLLGGLGIWFSSPTASTREYARQYHDLDFISHRNESGKVQKFFVEMGYSPRELFNKLQGGSRLMFLDPQNARRVDIFLDEFAMCHKFNFKDRLELCEKTLHPSDLMITKLQIYEINRKDMIDIAALVLDTPTKKVGEGNHFFDLDRIASICAEDWAVYKTITLNISRMLGSLQSLSLPAEHVPILKEKLGEIRERIESTPKSFRWRMRAKIGEKVRWYELPESEEKNYESK